MPDPAAAYTTPTRPRKGYNLMRRAATRCKDFGGMRTVQARYPAREIMQCTQALVGLRRRQGECDRAHERTR